MINPNFQISRAVKQKGWRAMPRRSASYIRYAQAENLNHVDEHAAPLLSRSAFGAGDLSAAGAFAVLIKEYTSGFLESGDYLMNRFGSATELTFR
jgi:hypothetical protein